MLLRSTVTTVFLSVLTFGSLVSAAEDLIIHISAAPSHCDTVEVSWSGGTPDYTLSVASSDSDVPISTYPAIPNGTVQWLVAIPAGERVNLTVQDRKGAQNSVSLVGAASSSSNVSCLDDALVSNRLLSHHSSTGYHPTSSSGSSGPLTPAETALTIVVVVICLFIVVFVVYRRLNRGQVHDTERAEFDEQMATPLITEHAPRPVAPWERATSGEATVVGRDDAKPYVDPGSTATTKIDAPPPYASASSPRRSV